MFVLVSVFLFFSYEQPEDHTGADYNIRLPVTPFSIFFISTWVSVPFSQFETQNYRPALILIDDLLRELKRLDDKMILTEVHLLESRVNHATKNFAKAKAALTSARTSAASIYCPPLLQAQLDMQSGMLHTEEKDYKTGYSYFFETFEGFSAQDDGRALPALKNMCLCKIMMTLVSLAIYADPPTGPQLLF